jgi:WD40 repeat protein
MTAQPPIPVESGIRGLVFSVDGTMVVTGSRDGTLYFWDSASGDLLHTLSAHTDTIWKLQFSRDGSRLFTSSSDGTFRVWEIR